MTDTAEASRPDAASGTQVASGPGAETLGVDSVQWPGDLDGAQAVFDRMPEEFAGMPVQRPEFYGPSTGLVYGPDNTGVTAYAVGPEGHMQDPVNNLAAMFGMGMICKEGTFAGTAAHSQWGGGPDINRGNESEPDDGLWWFSCQFEAGESVPFTGHAIGWVSGELAWLVTSPDEATTELTIAALIEAAA